MHWKIHNFEIDVNLLNFSHSIKKINEQVDFALENLNNWFHANKVCLNVSKIEAVFLKPPNKRNKL